MSTEHFLWIPGVFLIGLFVGYQMGARAVRLHIERLRKRGEDV